MKQPDWDTRYASWGLRPKDLERGYSNSRLLDGLRQVLVADGPLRVLEVGCAPGRWLAWVAASGRVRGFGIDLNRAGLVLSRQVCARCGFARADALQMPFPDASFDVVFSLGVVEHFEDPTPLLREQHRVLRSGGRVLASVPNIGAGTLHGWHWRRFRTELYALHVPYTPDALRRALESAGFTGVSTEQSGVYAPHAQKVIKLVPGGLVRRLERPSLASNLIATGWKAG